jgi:hypothetical protein
MVRGRTRYVSKAIMCVVRMQYLRRIFPDARFLLYVRNPIDHVASLIKQDRIWAEIEKTDPRQIEIIELTGHHEFGPKQVMANVGSPETLASIRRLFDDGRWAQSRARYWAYVYGFVAKQLDDDPELARSVCIVRYEDLCSDSPATIDRIIAHAGLDPKSFEGPRAAYSEKLSFPDYYKPSFEPDVLSEIVASTSEVAKRFNYDVPEIAQRIAASSQEKTTA